MTLDEAFGALGGDDEVPPIHCLLSAWEDAEPRCLALLHSYAAGEEVPEQTELSLFPIVHLLADRSVAAAFPDLCALLADFERASLIFGDLIDMAAPRLLISCFDGDAARLHALIEDSAGDPGVKFSALLATAYLTQVKRLSRSEMHAYLQTLFDTLPPDTDFLVWLGLANAVALLGFRALAGRAASLFETGLIPPDLMGLQDFRADLKYAQEDPTSLTGFDHLGIGPQGSAIAALAAYDEDGPEPETPIVNPLRTIGRNDPCPCGSGKKFKKCCLV